METKVYRDSQNYYRWKIIAQNNKIVAASSEGFSTEQMLVNNFNLVKSYFKTLR